METVTKDIYKGERKTDCRVLRAQTKPNKAKFR